MAGPRVLAKPPTFVDRQYGLLSVVEARYDEPDRHWRNGITYQDICQLGGSTYDPYCLASGTGTTPAAKAANVFNTTYGALPFTVFAEVDCSPVGYSQDEQRARALDALSRTETYQVENVFWTGAAGGDTGIVYPHLAADTAVVDTTILPNATLQCAVTPVSGVGAFEVVEAIGRLEAAMGACYNGQITLHVPLVLAERLISSAMVAPNGPVMMTKTGNKVAFGAGYPGTSPAQATTAGVAWVYATAPVVAYRGAPETFAFREELDRTTNTVKSIVERNYLLAFPCCCVYGVPVIIGGGVPL
jgi:hypothetical protein